jgi:hypothetical protein
VQGTHTYTKLDAHYHGMEVESDGYDHAQH